MSAAQIGQLSLVMRGLRAASEFHHGDAVGADRQAAAEAALWINEKQIYPHPAGDDPLDRNREIVDAVDVLIAAPETDREVQRSGTWMTVRYARKTEKPVIMLSRGAR